VTRRHYGRRPQIDLPNPAPGIDSSGRVPRRQLGHVLIAAVIYPLVDVGAWVDPGSGGTNASVVYHPGNLVTVAGVAYLCVEDTTSSPPGAAWQTWDESTFFLNAQRVWTLVPPGLLGGPGLDDTILGLEPDAWYKLDDVAGDAIDLSGGAHDLSATGAPTRGVAAGPPGTLTTEFPISDGFGGPSVADGYTPATADDFSCAGYVYRTDDLVSYLFGQGDPVSFNTAGWALGIEAFNQGTGNRLILYVGGAGGPFAIEGNNALAIDTWYHVAVTRIAGVWRIYVNGLLQAATYSGTGATADFSALPFWIAYNNVAAHAASTIRASYVTVFATRGLSGGEVLAIPTVAITGGVPTAGEVPIANGDGTISYGFPTYTVYIDGA
jgi:hypothetical protein